MPHGHIPVVERMEPDLTGVDIGPEFERALEDLQSTHFDNLTVQDMHIITQHAMGLGRERAYRVVHRTRARQSQTSMAGGEKRFWERDEVRAAVQLLKKKYLFYSSVTMGQKLNMLWDVANFCAGTMFDQEGNEIMKNPTAVRNAIAEMNKMTGDYAPEKREVTVTQVELTEEELLAKISDLTTVLDMKPELLPIDITSESQVVNEITEKASTSS